MLAVDIKKSFKGGPSVISKYFKILFELNDIHVTSQEANVLAYAAYYGELSTIRSRSACMRELNIPVNSLNNAVHTLNKKGLLKKVGPNKTNVINPALNLDTFKEDLLLRIELSNGTN